MVRESARIEKALKESERRLSTLLANAPAYLYRCLNKPGWPNEFVSDYAYELTGYSPEELTNGSVMFGDLIVEEDRERVWEEVQTALAERKRFGLRYAIHRRDGELRYVEEHGQGVFGEDGEVVALEGVVHDVTGRELAEEALKEAEEKYRTLVEQIPAIVYVDTLEGVGSAGYTSPQAEAVLGYPMDEWDADPLLWVKLLHPEDRERVVAENTRANANGEPVVLEYRMIARDGRVVWIRDDSVVLHDNAGRPWRRQGVLLDVTERKEAEEKFREAETRYRSLVENVPVVTYIQEPEPSKVAMYTVVYMGPQVEDILGYPPQKFMDNPEFWYERVHPDDLEGVVAEDARTDETGEPFRMEYRMIARDGRVVWIRDEAVLIHNPKGGPLYWQGVMSDITERKEREESIRTSEAELRALFAAMNDIILTLDAEGRYLKVAPTNLSLLYKPPEALIGKTLHEVFPQERADVFLGHVRRALKARRPVNIEYSLPIGGEEVWFAATVSPMAEDQVICVARDMTERKEAEEALRKSEANLAEAQRLAHVGSWEWDLRTGEIFWSDEVFRIYGIEPKEFIPDFERLVGVVHPDDRELLRSKIDGALHQGEPYDFEHRIVRPNGEERVVHRRAEVVRGEDSEPLRMVGTVHDVTERKALEEQLQRQALHDPLTRLPNRVLFTDRLKQALRRAKRRRGEVAVLFADLDNFKVVNDSLGHKTGDRLLVAVSKRIRTLLRPEDTVARLGGDEFVFLLEDTDVAGAVRVAESVSEVLRAPFSLSGRQLFVTASVGVSVGGLDGKHAADLLRDADLAMYRAKHSGKARYALFEEVMNARALERLETEHGLRRALEHEEFVVRYQPNVRISSGEIVGFEALVRWEHPERGLLLPEEFVPLAEETGLIVPIGERVLEEACRQAKEWQQQRSSDPPVVVCVNLSARQFRESSLAETIARILDEIGLDPRYLFLEVTESTTMSDAVATVAALKQLQDLGVRVMIDDFGTGYSSLSYLERFPVDYVKIHRSFVGGLGKDPGAAVLVSGVIHLAHALDLEVIAEGVETAEQLERLREMECDLAQGYLFSEPLPAQGVADLLAGLRHRNLRGRYYAHGGPVH
jgi:diguanylate cyclase (GGDEF)-like protein/PAS domain S-box-containing protein